MKLNLQYKCYIYIYIYIYKFINKDLCRKVIIHISLIISINTSRYEVYNEREFRDYVPTGRFEMHCNGSTRQQCMLCADPVFQVLSNKQYIPSDKSTGSDKKLF